MLVKLDSLEIEIISYDMGEKEIYAPTPEKSSPGYGMTWEYGDIYFVFNDCQIKLGDDVKNKIIDRLSDEDIDIIQDQIKDYHENLW